MSESVWKEDECGREERKTVPEKDINLDWKTLAADEEGFVKRFQFH